MGRQAKKQGRERKRRLRTKPGHACGLFGQGGDWAPARAGGIAAAQLAL
ncbi:hypothetical protein J2Z31_002465 [Sinorhizobium kostiense]|uniref:Uncharacterized protein n=1 Tax=Sinorhizobium kostiense TaxID=76747 RepID=A0ABS4QZC2_9HYPH|nr:hypothetical protein [Sinorhizobium kostiense]